MKPLEATDPGPKAAVQPREQLRYARWLEWGTRVGFVVLVVVFVVYVLGLVEPRVPPERLPELWTLPLPAFLAATGLPTGWGWLALAGHGDMANLAGIALLVGCSLPPLLALLPAFARRRDGVYVGLAAAQIVVLLLAASGVLTAGH